MEVKDYKYKVVLNGEVWEKISAPSGWRNTVTGESAGEPWMERKLEEEQAEEDTAVTE